MNRILLLGCCLWFGAMSFGCGSAPQPDAVASPKSPAMMGASDNASSPRDIERAIHQQINDYRRSQNLPALKMHPKIRQQARLHSRAMADDEEISHDGFQERVEILSRAIAYEGAAENVATNMGYQEPATKAVVGWIDSPGHHANILGDYNLTGVGVTVTPLGHYYFTQIFIKGP